MLTKIKLCGKVFNEPLGTGFLNALCAAWTYWVNRPARLVRGGKNMYAIFENGSKQYKVSVGDLLKVEKLNADGTVEFDQVLMVGDKIGTPTVAGAKVIATVVEQKRNDKVLVFKKKRRQNYRRTAGHRQFVTVLKITDIKG